MTSENCPCWTIHAHLSVFCVNSMEFGGQVLFIATSCWEKGLFLLQQDIVSFNCEFYCWKEASGEQRVGLILPIFAVPLRLRGDHLSRDHCQRRDLLNYVECKCLCYFGFGWPRDDHISAARVYAQRHLHRVILALMHNQKHARCCTFKLPDSARGDPSDLYPQSVTVHIQQNSHVITWLN